jgi:hypothetical protein
VFEMAIASTDSTATQATARSHGTALCNALSTECQEPGCSLPGCNRKRASGLSGADVVVEMWTSRNWDVSRASMATHTNPSQRSKQDNNPNKYHARRRLVALTTLTEFGFIRSPSQPMPSGQPGARRPTMWHKGTHSIRSSYGR